MCPPYYRAGLQIHACGHLQLLMYVLYSFFQSVELNIHYWNPVGTSNDIYTQITSKKYTIIQPSGVQLTAMIGEGEFGEVYKGEWTTDDNVVKVAVKVLKESASEDDRAKLLKEAALMGQFNHEHVVKLFGVANDGKQVQNTQTHTHARTHTQMYTHTHARTHTRTHTHTHTHTHIYIHIHL